MLDENDLWFQLQKLVKFLESVFSVIIPSESHTSFFWSNALCQMMQKRQLFLSSLLLLLSIEEIKVKNLTEKNVILQSAWIQKVPVIAALWSNLHDYDKSSPLRSWYCKSITTRCNTEIIKSLYQECAVWPSAKHDLQEQYTHGFLLLFTLFRLLHTFREIKLDLSLKSHR